MTLINRHKPNAVKLIMILMTVSILTACGGGNSSTSIDNPGQDAAGEKAKWSFKWDKGSVWQ